MSKDPTLSLLLLYEFEAKLMLDPSDLKGLLERVSQLPCVEAKTFETMTALSVRAPPSGGYNWYIICMYVCMTYWCT